jgi:quercetin dioxygenase-like cupin family protein
MIGPPNSAAAPENRTMSTKARLYSWDEMPLENMNPLLDRRVISGERMMIAQVLLKKGSVVPQHSHENEQITYIVSGALRFLLGEEQDEEVIVRAGSVLVIPSNLPHSALALEDTVDVDIFCPPRADWLDGSDDYLRQD